MIAALLEDALNTTKKHLEKLRQLDIYRIEDLLNYFPRTYNDSSEFTKIIDITTNQTVTVKGRITNLINLKTKYRKTITRALLTDSTGSVDVVWFNQPHLSRMIRVGSEIILTGKAKFSFKKLTLQSPTFELPKRTTELIHSGRIVPVYSETDGISSKWLREKIKILVDRFADSLPDPLPPKIIQQHGFISYAEAIKNIHFPENAEMLEKARERLAFDEIFNLQIKVLEQKKSWQQIKEEEQKVLKKHTEVLDEAKASLPFQLTNAQERILEEILTDLEKPVPMYRLVQGDVGSGKTIVAALSALNVVRNGYQVAVMAPTEILAKQHYKTFIKVLKNYGLNIQFIAGSLNQKEKDKVVMQMQTGTLDIIIGTHSLIQQGIGFKNLGLAIIDEQHRFGVEQRNTLKSHNSPHLMSMTATPIPRTLAITLYGDQDLSIIDEMPAGRQTINTHLVPDSKRADAYRWIENQIQQGRQAFVICPLIEDSEALEHVKSVTQEYAYLNDDVFPHLNVALLHGKLKQDEKDQIMEDFKEKKYDILVSTSVIEVGIDVPNATIMLIEGAERFGLSQLHQFRGRVGRGEHKSYCFLFTGPLSVEGKRRMKSMEQYSDGFKLAEIDLELRGPGEIYGTKQSGLPDLRVANLTDTVMIEKARKSAEEFLNSQKK